jgi:hypothetical protein
MSRTVLRLTASCLQNLSLQGRRDHRRLLSRVADLQLTSNAILHKAVFPARDRKRCRIELLLNRSIWQTIGEQKNEPSSEDVARRERA